MLWQLSPFLRRNGLCQEASGLCVACPGVRDVGSGFRRGESLGCREAGDAPALVFPRRQRTAGSAPRLGASRRCWANPHNCHGYR